MTIQRTWSGYALPASFIDAAVRPAGKRVHPPTLDDDESDLGEGTQLLAETNDTGARGGDMLKAGETMGGDGGAREESAEEPNVKREAL